MIFISPIKKVWSPGSRMEYFKLNPNELTSFEEFVASKYVEYVERTVKLGRYNQKLVPLSKSWETFKYNNNLNINPWIATGELIEALRFDPKKMQVGFKHASRHYSGLTNLQLSRVLEYGSTIRSIPPRPLFRLTHQQFSKNIAFYFSLWKGGRNP